MNLLYENDQTGVYPQSWYAATSDALEPFAPLKGSQTSDVCVLGAGYTGLSAALHLAKLGYSVSVLEAQRIGFGASGRNGGQLGSGQRVEQDELISRLGEGHAKQLWDLAEHSKALVHSLIEAHQIDCHVKPGIAEFALRAKEMDELHRYADLLHDHYGYEHIETLNVAQGRDLCASPRYHGGYIDWGAAHLHPLKLCFGLARAAQKAGVRFFEGSEVKAIKKGRKIRVSTPKGDMTSDFLVLACNGYLGAIEPRIAARVMPINNFIAVSEPLEQGQWNVLQKDIAVADTKFVVNYFRKTHDNRLLFGGGENYSYRFPKDLAATVRAPMTHIFPQLKDIKLDYAWGGTLAITMTRLPYFTRSDQNILSASGYSGHGVGMATLAGKLMAEAIEGRSRDFDCFQNIPSLPFPGGRFARTPLLVLAMIWYQMRDRLGF